MAQTIKINSVETDNNAHSIDLMLKETSIDLTLYDRSTIHAVRNCNQNFENSNLCRKNIMQSLCVLSNDMKNMGIIFNDLDKGISKQWSKNADGL